MVSSQVELIKEFEQELIELSVHEFESAHHEHCESSEDWQLEQLL